MGITGTSSAVGIQGMGGIGKTVLAMALVHDPEVRRAFPEGIFWLAVGQKPLVPYCDTTNFWESDPVSLRVRCITLWIR